jgi:hypothetical protein
MSPCFSHICAAKIKNSGDGGPVGTLSEIASVRGWAGCITGWVVGFDFPTPKYWNGCFQAEVSEFGGAPTGCAPCQVGGACAVVGAGAGAGVVGADFDQGQKLEDDDWAAGAEFRADIAIEAGSARAVVAASPSAVTAAGIDLRQAVCMAVLLDVVDRRHPCQRLINSN